MTADPNERERTQPRRAPDVVVEHLENLIFDRTYEPGDSLPSEAELSAALNVSRLSVREGVRSLVARGLIEVSHGRRPTVVGPNATQLRDFFSSSVRRDTGGLLELLEIRLAIEVHAAQLAARQATEPELDAIRAALQDMIDAEDDDDFTSADMRFHHAITAASGNRMISLLVEGMSEPLKVGRLQSLRGYRQQAPDLGDLINEHRAVLDKITARDASGAARAMRAHLATTRRDLLRALSG